MCVGCFPADIITCSLCKRDEEGYKTGDFNSPFVDTGWGNIAVSLRAFVQS